jgi:hypothetical protein
MGLEAAYAGTAANPVDMRGFGLLASVSRGRGGCTEMLEHDAFARTVVPPVVTR